MINVGRRSRDKKRNRAPLSKGYRVMVAIMIFFWISVAAYFLYPHVR